MNKKLLYLDRLYHLALSFPLSLVSTAMPSSQGHGNQQRRIFRGKGGAPDGRLPPKKNPRVRVKYQPDNSDEVNGDAHAENESISNESDADDGSELDQSTVRPGDADEDAVSKEIKHLEKRISNIQTSIQTSSGLSNPQTWYNNCLLPVKNAVKEWRSICKYHVTSKEAPQECATHKDMINETSVQVYNLLQMAMQSGPLTGSNPGYFKRCGGECASVALVFLKEIVDLAGVKDVPAEPKAVGDATKETDDNTRNEHVGNDEEEHDEMLLIGAAFDRITEIHSSASSGSDDSSESDSSSSSTRGHSDAIEDELPQPSTSTLTHTSQLPIIQALQSGLLLSNKQSQRIYQWIQNADKAVIANKGPSKSAKKLQGQKSKKQQMKELKMERKMKKKKKGGGK